MLPFLIFFLFFFSDGLEHCNGLYYSCLVSGSLTYIHPTPTPLAPEIWKHLCGRYPQMQARLRQCTSPQLRELKNYRDTGIRVLLPGYVACISSKMMIWMRLLQTKSLLLTSESVLHLLWLVACGSVISKRTYCRTHLSARFDQPKRPGPPPPFVTLSIGASETFLQPHAWGWSRSISLNQRPNRVKSGECGAYMPKDRLSHLFVDHDDRL